MKKIFRIAKFVALILALAVILTACGDKVPKGWDADTWELGQRALTVIDKYNKAEISKDEMLDALDIVETGLQNIHDSLDEDPKYHNILLSVAIGSYRYEHWKNNGDPYSAEKEIRRVMDMR